MKFDDLNDSELWAIANSIMDNLMDGSTKVDHAQHCRDFTQRMKDIVTSEYLERVCHHYQRTATDFLLNVSQLRYSDAPIPSPLFGSRRIPLRKASLWQKWCWLKKTDVI